MVDYIQFAIVGITLGCIYALVALGFHFIYRATGVLDFAQGEKVLIGGLVVLSFQNWGISLLPAIFVAVLVGLFAGAVYGGGVIAPTYRRPGFAPIVATVGASLVLFYGQQLIWGPEARPFSSLPGETVESGGIRIEAQYFWVWGSLAVILLSLWLFFQKTREGQGMIAASTDPIAAAMVGINVPRMRIYAFALAFGLAILAGILVAPITLAGGTIGLSLMLKAFAGAILGGITSPAGVVVGSLIIGVADTETSGIWGFGWREPIVFSIIILVLLVRPNGLFGSRSERAG